MIKLLFLFINMGFCYDLGTYEVETPATCYLLCPNSFQLIDSYSSKDVYINDETHTIRRLNYNKYLCFCSDMSV